jgi:hypothetical protein
VFRGSVKDYAEIRVAPSWGSQGGASRRHPSHATVHADPCTAVRWIVRRAGVEERQAERDEGEVGEGEGQPFPCRSPIASAQETDIFGWQIRCARARSLVRRPADFPRTQSCVGLLSTTSLPRLRPQPARAAGARGGAGGIIALEDQQYWACLRPQL